MNSFSAILLLAIASANTIFADEPFSIEYTPFVPQRWVWPFTMGDYATTATWRFPQAVCAQMKVISVGEPMPRSNPNPTVTKEVRPWGMPSHPWQRFLIAVGYVNYANLKPDRFRFVLPNVTLRGFSANFEQPADSEPVWLFNKASTGKDIKVQFYPIVGTPKLGQEYKGLHLFSEQENLAWDVYVRFREATILGR